MAQNDAEEYRHELKYIINNSDIWALRNRLRFVMERDPHVGRGGRYFIRSLYYDNIDDDLLYEKLDGVSYREKFRIRIYNAEDSFIRLEKKIKKNGMCRKEEQRLTREEAERLIAGDVEWLKEREEPLLKDLFYQSRVKGIKPKTIVEYTREPYIYRYGNVRVTIDSNVRTGLHSKDLFDPDLLTVPVLDNGKSILEVKYDAYLPDVIKLLVQSGSRELTQASKYAFCRIYL